MAVEDCCYGSYSHWKCVCPPSNWKPDLQNKIRCTSLAKLWERM
jgi:hypothetical protein